MIQMTGMRLSDRAMRQQIASALNVVVQVARMTDGSRRVTSIAEITGMEGETITMQEDIHVRTNWRRCSGPGAWKIQVNWYPSGFAERLKAFGMQLPRAFFEEL